MNKAPRIRTFKEILNLFPHRSTDWSFAEFIDSPAEVLQLTLRDGISGIIFPDRVISSLSEPLKFSLIGRITDNRGSNLNYVILDVFSRTRLLVLHIVKFLPRGFMILTLSTEEDYIFFWNKSVVTIGRVSIRFSKWTLKFKFEEDSPIAPV